MHNTEGSLYQDLNFVLQSCVKRATNHDIYFMSACRFPLPQISILKQLVKILCTGRVASAAGEFSGVATKDDKWDQDKCVPMGADEAWNCMYADSQKETTSERILTQSNLRALNLKFTTPPRTVDFGCRMLIKGSVNAVS